MERCINCNKEIDKQTEMNFCPYCGQKFDLKEIAIPSKLSQEVEIIWGNQGVYAKKVLILCHNLIALLRKNVLILDEEKALVKSIELSSGYLEERFDSLVASHSHSEFSESYQDLMKEAYDFSHDNNRGESSIRMETSIVISNITEFEKTIQLPYKTNFIFQAEEYYGSSIEKISIELLDRFHNIINTLFEKVGEITADEGLFIILNSDFDKNKLKILKNIDLKDESLITTEIINYAIEVMSEGYYNPMEFTSSDDYFIELFLEVLWLYLKVVSENSSIIQNENIYKLLMRDMSQWIDHIEVSIDRSKYISSLDMIGVYQKGYDFITLISEKPSVDKEAL